MPEDIDLLIGTTRRDAPIRIAPSISKFREGLNSPLANADPKEKRRSSSNWVTDDGISTLLAALLFRKPAM